MNGHLDENTSVDLLKLPAELVLNFVFPYLGASDLKNLTEVCCPLNDIVKLFIQSFNRVVNLSTPCTLEQFSFMTNNASKLVILDLSGFKNSPRLRNHPLDLKTVILMNKNLEEVYIPNIWISSETVEALARNASKLKIVQLSTFKIRLYELTDGTSRKLWPCSCWGTEKKLEHGFEFGEYFLPDTLWRSRTEKRNKETEERKLLNNLRIMKKNLDFRDFAWKSDKKDENMIVPILKDNMAPLDYHEHKCRNGMFYDGNNDQDNFGLAHYFDAIENYGI